MSTFCQHPSDNHSNDLVRVYRGVTTPLNLCWYHAEQDLNKIEREIEEAKK